MQERFVGSTFLAMTYAALLFAGAPAHADGAARNAAVPVSLESEAQEETASTDGEPSRPEPASAHKDAITWPCPHATS